MENCINSRCIYAYGTAEKPASTWKQRIVKLLTALQIEGAEHMSKIK